VTCLKILSQDSPREEDESHKIAGIPATIGTRLISSAQLPCTRPTCGIRSETPCLFLSDTTFRTRKRSVAGRLPIRNETHKNANVPRATLEPTTYCSSGERGCMPENYTTSRTFHALKKCARSRQSKVATGRISGSIPSRDIHLCSGSVQPALELLVQGVLGAVFPGVKWLEREADHSPRPVLYLRVELIPHAFMTCIETDNCSQEY